MISTWRAADWNRLLILVLLGGGLLIALTRAQSAETTLPAAPAAADALAPAAQVDHPAPDFTLSDLTGAPVSLSALKGQVVLLNIWATWCPPCRAEMPAMQAILEQYRERGFTVLAVNQAEDAATVAAFTQQYGLSFTTLLDSDSAVSRAYQVRVLPSSFFIDRNGIVRVVYFGPMPRSVIAGTVEQLLQEGR